MDAQKTTIIDVTVQVSDETGSGAKSAEENVTKLEKSIMNLQKQITGMQGKSKIEVAATLKDMASKGIQNVASAGKSIAGKIWTVTLKAKDLATAPFKKILGMISNPVTKVAAVSGVSLGVAGAVKTYADFEAAMSKVQAISGASGTEMEKLTKKAEKMGEKTKFSAKESADAMNYMAMAGWKTKDMLGGIDGIMNLAAASGEDLATTSDIVTDALTAFNMKASDAKRFSDVLAAAASSSNTNVSMMGETFKYASAIAGTMGYSIEDTALATGLMAAAGIKASMSGTALNTIITRIATDAGASSTKLGALGTLTKQLGVEFYDSKGNARDFSTVLKEMREATNGMTAAEKSHIAKTIAGEDAQRGLLVMLNASEKDFRKMEKSINNSDGAAKKMAKTMQENLKGSITQLKGKVENMQNSLGKKMSPYIKDIVKWMSGQIPEVKKALNGFLDTALDKVDDIKDKFAKISASDEFKNADFFGKISIAWDKIIAEPFSEWWNGSGKTWLAGKAQEIGKGLGSALHDGIMGLLGIDVGGAAADGADIGKSFAKAFIDAFDGAEVGKAIWKAVKDGMKGLVSDAATLLPGGKETSGTAYASAALLGAGALKTGKGIHKVYKGVKAVGKVASKVTGFSEGIKIAKAAKSGGAAAESAMALAKGGALGSGVKAGAKAASAGSKIASAASKTGSKIASAASKAAVPLAGITSAVEMGLDAYHGTEKAGEWTGSESIGNKVASGVGAALGGTGKGVLSSESTGKKALDVGGGALKGAGIGAAAGSVIPGVGTAVGAGVGAAVGAAGAAVGGSNIAKGISKAGKSIKELFTDTIPERFGEFKDGAKEFFTESVPGAVSSAKEKIGGFFTETVPEKFGEFKDGIGSLFSEQIPYGIGYAGGKIAGFFTETIPERFGELWTGISNFFAETVPAAVSTAGAAITNFFTSSVPQFFSGLWKGVTGFFTETLPEGLEAVGGALKGFFTETVPQFFGNLWDGISTFFTETLPEGLEMIGAGLKTFFTETVPGKIKEIWDGVLGFFTETIPGAVSTISDGISGFFTGIKDKVTGFFGDLKDKVTGFLGGAAESVSAGYHDATARHAEGGIMTRPHLGLVAEDGAEAIIPLSGKRRKRGISLWEKAGKMLGVKPYAEGGIIGIVNPEYNALEPSNPDDEPTKPSNPDDDTTKPSNPKPSGGNSGMNVPVTIQNMTFEININGGDTADTQSIMAVIKDNIRGLADDIAYQIATAIQQVYANTPLAEWEV